MAKPSPIEPGRVYAYDVDAWNTCQVFKKGHRIRLERVRQVRPQPGHG